jgi:hypothetical protein
MLFYTIFLMLPVIFLVICRALIVTSGVAANVTTTNLDADPGLAITSGTLGLS